MNHLDQAINLRVKITNLLDEVIQGLIYAFSPKQKVLAIQLSNASQKSETDGETIKLINTAFIKSIQILPNNRKNQKGSDSHRRPRIDIPQLEAKINAAVLKAQSDSAPAERVKPSPANANNGAQKKNTKMSPLTLKVYDKLSLTLGKENVQVQNNESILLFKEVTVAKPYALNKISNSKRAQNSKHIEKARAALREVWLGPDELKRGG